MLRLKVLMVSAVILSMIVGYTHGKVEYNRGYIAGETESLKKLEEISAKYDVAVKSYKATTDSLVFEVNKCAKGWKGTVNDLNEATGVIKKLVAMGEAQWAR